MQTRLFINNTDNVKFLDNDVSGIYFGVEFCDQLLPSGKDLDFLVRFSHKSKVPVSIVTPYLNECNFEGITKLLDSLNERMPNAEVVVNDWGVLNLIKDNYDNFSIIIGRLLSRQKRGFFVKRENGENVLIENLKLKRTEKDYMKCSIMQNDYLMEFLKKMGIKRISLDNMRQGVVLTSKGIKTDVYYPYIFITTSNYCLTSAIHKSSGMRGVIDSCNGICRKVQMREMEICGEKIYLYGNTQFYFNDRVDNLSLTKGDRLIRVIL